HLPTGLTKRCLGESGVKQNSDTRARRQHSTVPVDKGLSTLRLICGLTGNIVRPGSTETPSSMNRRPPCRWPAPTPIVTATARGIFHHHGGERSAPEKLVWPNSGISRDC